MAKRAPKKQAKKKLSLEIRQEIAKLTLMNNAFMNLALENNFPCVEEILRVILGKSDLVVKKAQTQRMFQGFSRSIYLDVFAEDSNGTFYNIEIQQANEGADTHRARFHAAMIDAHALKASQDFKELPEVYVIFITLNDVLELNQTIYTIHKYIDGTSERFNDGSHIIYINGAARDDGTDVWKLIHDLRCPNADEMYFPNLAERVKFFKEDEAGMIQVSTYFEEREAKAVEKAVEKAEKKKTESFALKCLELGKMTLEEIANCTGLTLRQVQALANMH